MRHILLILCALALFCCASATQNKRARTAQNIITAEEIAQSTAKNAYEAVQLLRPNLLRIRGSRGRGVALTPLVYLDNIEFGQTGSLRDIPSHSIKEIRFLGAADATIRFGSNNMAGAFLVTSKTN
ncbi:MAG: hypothetical protein ACE5G1_00190 [bacterium]